MPPTPFGTILTIFAKFKYYFNFDKLTITLQPSRNEELGHFLILIEKYCICQLLWSEKSQSSWFLTKIWCYFSIWWKEVHQQLITYHKLIELFLVDFYAPFEQGGAYCFAHVGRYVGQMVGMSVSLNLVQLITQEYCAQLASNLVGR